MDLLDFLSALRGLSESDIRELAHRLQARFVSPADEVEWWRANLAIERLACTSRARSHAVTAAGCEAARAVVGAAQRSHVSLPDTDVTCVARAANRVARALRLGSDGAVHLGTLLKGWSSPSPTSATCRPAWSTRPAASATGTRRAASRSTPTTSPQLSVA